MKIPFLDLKAQYNSIKDEVLPAINDVLENTAYVLGKPVQQFEDNFAKEHNAAHCIGVGTGTAGNHMVLWALGLKRGDEVIIPANTFIATAWGATLCGATPVFVDCEPDSYNIDPSKIVSAITKKTKAIVAVHLYGQPADIDAIIEAMTNDKWNYLDNGCFEHKFNGQKIYLVEDAAQAFMSEHKGKYLGTYGDIGCFSLSMAKLISTGQGGFIVTNSEELNTRIRRMRTHGVSSTFEPERWNMKGGNFRYTDLQAAIGLQQLSRINEKKKKCLELYLTYIQELNLVEDKILPIKVEHSKGEIPIYNEFSCSSRENLINYLKKHGIEARPFYPAISTAAYITGEKNARKKNVF